MDVVAKIKSHEDISEILPITIEAFRPTLEANQSIHDAISRQKTFQFGATKRHQLDVYYPTSNQAQAPPILFVIYGGGFVSGARTQASPNSIAYGNVGTYFASKGYLTIIPDYRLAPAFKYPKPPGDVRDAIDWTLENLSTVNPGVGADAKRAFIISASAGVHHTLAALISPDLPFKASTKVGSLAGLVLVGGVYENFPSPMIEAYFESVELSKGKDPLGWLTAESAKNLPPSLIVLAEHEPSFIMASGKKFISALHDLGRNDTDIIGKGHNHISIFWGLGTNDKAAEEWANEATQWMNEV